MTTDARKPGRPRDDWKACNCSGCGRLLASRVGGKPSRFPPVAGWTEVKLDNGTTHRRPLCAACAKEKP